MSLALIVKKVQVLRKWEKEHSRRDAGGMTEKKKLLIIGAAALAVYVLLKYALRYVLPFLIAWLLVRLLNPVLKKIRKMLPWKKEILVSILLFLVFVLVGVLLYFLFDAIMDQVGRVVANFDAYSYEMEQFLDDCCVSMERRTGVKAENMRSVINAGLEKVEVQFQGKLVPDLLNHSVQYFLGLLKAVGFVFIIYIGILLLMKDYDKIRQDLEQYELYHSVQRVTDRILHTGGTYLKSQFIIIGVVMVLCIVGLYLLGNSYALLLGILIGLLDALPFLGTGTVLLPWALVLALKKDFLLAAGYVLLFLVTNTARELLEPRLVGDRIGIYPFAFALSVYAGICLFGPVGAITGPIGVVLVMEISREVF